MSVERELIVHGLLKGKCIEEVVTKYHGATFTEYHVKNKREVVMITKHYWLALAVYDNI